MLNTAVQSADVQSGCLTIRRSSSWDGIREGDDRAVGTLSRKEEARLRDKSSANTLSLPGMCVASNLKLCLASKKNKHLSKCINSGLRLDL